MVKAGKKTYRPTPQNKNRIAAEAAKRGISQNALINLALSELFKQSVDSSKKGGVTFAPVQKLHTNFIK